MFCLKWIAQMREQDELIKLLENDKKEYENKCQDLMSDLESAQEHKKRIEQNYNEEIKLLNNKIKELNNYIQELETKNTQRLRDSIGTEVKFNHSYYLNFKKWRGISAVGTDDDLREECQRHKNDKEFMILEIKKTLDNFEFEDNTEWEGYEKLKSLWAKLSYKEEERNHTRSPYKKNKEMNLRGLDNGNNIDKELLAREKAELEVKYNFIF